MFAFSKKEKEILKRGRDIVTNKIKSIPYVLWRDKKYVAIKVVGLLFMVWSVFELLNGSLDAYDRESYTLGTLMGAAWVFTPATLLQDALDGTPRRRKREEEE